MRRAVPPVALLIAALALGFGGMRAGADQAKANGSTPPGPVTPVLSARRVPAWLVAPLADLRLRSALDDVVGRSPPASCLTVTEGGRSIYDHNGDRSLIPASTEKLVTASVVLDELGPDRRLRTSVVTAAPVRDGVVNGDVFLVGGGDPILGTGDYADHFLLQPQLRTSLEDLATRVAKAGIRRVTGRILGDESRFDQERYVASWPPRFSRQNQTGPLSALTVNDNFSDFPPKEAAGVLQTAAADPPSAAAGKLDELLDTRGVRVQGGDGSGRAPAKAKVLAAVDSPPMRDLLGELLTESDNQTAETLTKELGRVKGKNGSTAAGVAVIRTAVARLGLPLAGAAINDGSGLDEGDRTTCGLLNALLDRSGRQSPIGEGLPVAGRTGTLTGRFLAGPAAGRLRAKTGTLNTVTALAGFVDTVPGAQLTFSYVANGRFVSKELLAVQDDLAAALVRYPEGPSLAELGPERG